MDARPRVARNSYAVGPGGVQRLDACESSVEPTARLEAASHERPPGSVRRLCSARMSTVHCAILHACSWHLSAHRRMLP